MLNSLVLYSPSLFIFSPQASSVLRCPWKMLQCKKNTYPSVPIHILYRFMYTIFTKKKKYYKISVFLIKKKINVTKLPLPLILHSLLLSRQQTELCIAWEGKVGAGKLGLIFGWSCTEPGLWSLCVPSWLGFYDSVSPVLGFGAPPCLC